MSKTGSYKLDNPVWHSLSENHKEYGITCDETLFYAPYCPFGAALNTKSSSAIAQYCNLSLIFLLLAKSQRSPTLKIANELVCLQMIISEPIDTPIIDTIIELEERNREDLLELVKLVYPEYFKSKTATLGNYYGIYKETIN
jgi:hypothetical protein